MSKYKILRRGLHIFPLLRNYFYIAFHRLYFRIIDISFGKHMRVYDRIYVRGKGNIRIGRSFIFSSGGNINPICRNLRGSLYVPDRHSSIVIGDHVGISSACIWAKKQVTIGNYVSIGGNCLIIDNDAHSLDYLKRRPSPETGKECNEYTSSPIVIEDDVWIGAQCIILKGVHIGARSIIAAGSVVTKNIPSDVLAGGNPCKIIRQLQESPGIKS